MSSLSSYVVVFILALGTIRGLIVLNTGVPVQTVYAASSALLITVSIYGWFTRRKLIDGDLLLLKKLLLLNMLLGIVNVVIDLLLGMPFSPGVLYLYLFPHAIFVFLRVPASYFRVAFIIVALAISYSVLVCFIESLKGKEGVLNVFEYNMKLRPDIFATGLGLSHTGPIYRPSGYTGDPHDSGNILGMMGSFFLIRFLVDRKWLDLGVALFALFSLTLTQSATNIVVALFTCATFSVYALVFRRDIKTLFGLMVIVLAVYCIAVRFDNVVTIFTDRVSEDGDWEGMGNRLSISSFLEAIPYFIIGHATALGSRIIDVEADLLKKVVQLGIFHASIFYWIMLYPIFRFVRVRATCHVALPAVAAIFFGFMSLLHYGSLFRSTSVGLYYAMCAMCLGYVLNAKSAVPGKLVVNK